MASTAEVEVEVEKSVRFAEAPAKEAAAAPEWWLKDFKGITMQDYGRSGACFLVLYVILGCLYGAMMTIAVDVRGSNYMSLPSKYFGAFDRDHDAGTHFQASGVRPRGYSVPTGCSCARMDKDAGLSAKASRALADGKCPDGTEAVVCDDQDGSKTARVYPWIVKYNSLRAREQRVAASMAVACGGTAWTKDWTVYSVSPVNMTESLTGTPVCGNAVPCNGNCNNLNA